MKLHLRSGLHVLSALLLTAIGACGPPSPSRSGARGAGSDGPLILIAREASGVSLPCVHVRGPGPLPRGQAWTIVSEAGPVIGVEVTASERGQTCGTADEEHVGRLENLAVPPRVDPGGGAYARCGERTGIKGSHRSLPQASGLLLAVRSDAIDTTRARVVRGPQSFSPPPRFDGTYEGLDTDGDGLADWFVGEISGPVADGRYPAGVIGGELCQEVHRRVAGVWQPVFRRCRERCEVVTY
ncbi:MAG: hypothetical protein AAGA56_15605 [Myxococcota bacterium]